MSHHTARKPRRVFRFLLAAGLVLLALAVIVSNRQPVEAKPDYQAVFRSTYPAAAGSALDSCTLCHTSAIPALNPYGMAYLTTGRSFASIEAKDSDGDGFTNLQEIIALTQPGDSSSRPAFSPTPTATRTPVASPTPGPTSTASSPTPTTHPPSVTASPTATPDNNDGDDNDGDDNDDDDNDGDDNDGDDNDGDDNDHSTPDPSHTPSATSAPGLTPTRTPQATSTPDDDTPEPTETPDADDTPEPSETPDADDTPEPDETPDADDAPDHDTVRGVVDIVRADEIVVAGQSLAIDMNTEIHQNRGALAVGAQVRVDTEHRTPSLLYARRIDILQSPSAAARTYLPLFLRRH